jgi:hypothetical protein
MLTRLRSHLTYANVAATMALFLALGGTGAYAANEWTGANIQDETLTGADVQGKAQTATAPAVNGTLTGYDISGQPAIPALGQPFIAGSLTTWDINDGTLMGPDVKDGSLTTSDILDGTLAARDLADNAVGTSQVANGSLQTQDFAPGVLATFRAYGLISGTSHTRSKNVVSVTNDLAGLFCITLAGGIDPRHSAPVATPDSRSGATSWGQNSDQAIVQIRSAGGDCNPGQLEVQTGYRRVSTAPVGKNDQVVVTSVDNVLSNQPFFFVLP